MKKILASKNINYEKTMNVYSPMCGSLIKFNFIHLIEKIQILDYIYIYI